LLLLLLLLPQANDLYAIINAVPAIALCLYGFLTPTMTGSLCFGAGLGITLFGIAYMFVHDGLVHKRFPTGPIAELPYMKRVTVAHKLHHSEKYNGVPWGLFLGPQVTARTLLRLRICFAQMSAESGVACVAVVLVVMGGVQCSLW
jgi:hypothetical protein